MRRVVRWCWAGLVGFLAGVVIVGSVPAVAEPTTCWRPPVAGVIIDPFRPPACVWCAGNRGVEYQVPDATVVRAAASGTVTFSGDVAGIRYIVVRLANGWRTTYGRLDTVGVELGDLVVAGGRVGATSGGLFFGLRIGEDYVDPTPFIGTVVGRARLVPVDGTEARPAPPPKVRCRVGESAR